VAYKINIKPSALKDLDSLPDKEVKKISIRLMQLKDNPRLVGVQKLSDQEGYRIRSGNYRILFEVNDISGSIFIYRIKHRKEVCK
jgi:mRNA interferase RelE/StbE